MLNRVIGISWERLSSTISYAYLASGGAITYTTTAAAAATVTDERAASVVAKDSGLRCFVLWTEIVDVDSTTRCIRT